jgi:hypothetical protein
VPVALPQQLLPSRQDLLAESVDVRNAGPRFDEHYAIAASGPNAPEHWLGDTPQLQLKHPRVRFLAKRLTQRHGDAYQKALACFEWVRALPFQFVPGGSALSAPEAIQLCEGDGRTKTIVLVALLRSAGLPSRIRVLSLPPYFLHGLLQTDGKLFKHFITEVNIDDHWLAVDTYIYDASLTLAVRSRLEFEQRHMGYGLHLAGDAGWPVRRSAFAHFKASDPHSEPRRQWGTYDDLQTFNVHHGRNPLHQWPRDGLARISVILANKRIASMRRSRLPVEYCK